MNTLPSLKAVESYKRFREEVAENRRKERAKITAETRSRKPSNLKLSGSQLMSKYRLYHSQSFATLKEKMKNAHLEKLRRLEDMRREEEKIRKGASSRGAAEKSEDAPAQIAEAKVLGSEGNGAKAGEASKQRMASRDALLATYREHYKQKRFELKEQLKEKYLKGIAQQTPSKSATDNVNTSSLQTNTDADTENLRKK